MECEYCKNVFNNKSSLKQHQNTAKYCLKLRTGESFNFTCPKCNKIFTLKSSMTRHKNSCTISNIELSDNIKQLTEDLKITRLKLEESLHREEELKKDKEKLMSDYAKLAANKSTIITNNTTNNNLNLSVFDKTPAEIKRIVEEKYDKNYLVDGQKGVARFTHLHVLKNEDSTKPPVYLITDKSRGNAKYKVSNTEVVTDIGMTGLTKKIHPSIKKKAILIAADDNFENQEVFDGYQEVFNMDDDNGIFRKELIKILEHTEE